MSHLEKVWDDLNIGTNPGYMKMVATVAEAVIGDLKESYELAMRAENLSQASISNIGDTVDDAIINNYDFLWEVE